MQAIIVEKSGKPSVLKIKNLPDPTKFRKNDVLIKQTAIGVNFFDIAFRNGQYPLNKYPHVIGHEACGVVEAVGSNVTEFKKGDRVAYATGSIGAYVDKRIIDKNHLVIVPDGISDEVAAASLYKGFMAHAALFRVCIAKRFKRILVHGASGGVGQFLCQWGRAIGLEVIGVVGNSEKISPALENGCKFVINKQKGNFYEELMKITKNEGVGVVYDCIGKETIDDSLKSLWPMGICVAYGETSGITPKIDLDQLALKSVYVTRPTMLLYKTNRVELALTAMEIFALIQKNILRPQITTFPFKDAAKAHHLVESRKSVGSVVLKL